MAIICEVGDALGVVEFVKAGAEFPKAIKTHETSIRHWRL